MTHTGKTRVNQTCWKLEHACATGRGRLSSLTVASLTVASLTIGDLAYGLHAAHSHGHVASLTIASLTVASLTIGDLAYGLHAAHSHGHVASLTITSLTIASLTVASLTVASLTIGDLACGLGVALSRHHVLVDGGAGIFDNLVDGLDGVDGLGNGNLNCLLLRDVYSNGLLDSLVLVGGVRNLLDGLDRNLTSACLGFVGHTWNLDGLLLLVLDRFVPNLGDLDDLGVHVLLGDLVLELFGREGCLGHTHHLLNGNLDLLS
eukprot:28392_3